MFKIPGQLKQIIIFALGKGKYPDLRVTEIDDLRAQLNSLEPIPEDKPKPAKKPKKIKNPNEQK